jgi:hypothetical protein
MSNRFAEKPTISHDALFFNYVLNRLETKAGGEEAPLQEDPDSGPSYIELFVQVKDELPDVAEHIIAESVAAQLSYPLRQEKEGVLLIELPDVYVRYLPE